MGSASVGGFSEQSSKQLRPAHSFTGGLGLFGVDDDLDNFAQYVNEEEEEEEEDDDEEQGEEHRAGGIVSFESDEESVPKQSAMKRLLRSFDRRKGKKPPKRKESNYSAPPLGQHVQEQTFQFQTQPQPRHSAPTVVSPYHNHHQFNQLHHIHQSPQNTYFPPPPKPAAPFHTKRPQSTLSKARDEPPSLEFNNTEILCTTTHSAPRSQSAFDYRTYNAPPKSTLPKIGSFDLDIDTIPASPKTAPLSPFSQDEALSPFSQEEEDPEEDQLIPHTSSWKSFSSNAFSKASNDHSTALVPYDSGAVELVDTASCSNGSTAKPLPSSLSRQASWEQRLKRIDIFEKRYAPSQRELEELQELEDYLGIFSAKTKHRFFTLWRELVPPLDDARRKMEKGSALQRTHSLGSVSTLSTRTNHHPTIHNVNKTDSTSSYSIVLKRGPVQFEEYQDYHCEWILLTHGFVVARPNYQYIPRFQAGDLWTSVVQIQATNPLSITISCTSRSTSTHLTLTQLKQQQQYGCYTYEFSFAAPDEQASWLDALRRVVVQAHDVAGTREKEMGGLGWQYRVVYVPFLTEAVTGNPIQKETILSGSTGHMDLNALDSYNSYAPLHYATRANHVRVMSFLLEAGADVHVGDGYGRTPMYYAELHQLPESTIQLLEAHGAQRSKKPALVETAQEVWRKRNCVRKLFIAAMVLLLLLCAAGALSWWFGVLEPLGIGGMKEESSSHALDAPTTLYPIETTADVSEVTSRAVATDAPTSAPTPRLFSRDISTPKPTVDRPTGYVKTAPPTLLVEVARQSPTTESPSFVPSAVPTPASHNSELFTLLESASFDAGAAMSVTHSPQNRAFLWLSDNANLNSYTNSKKIQRYALATLYYATSGDNWADNTWWLSDEDECIWFNKQVQTGYQACEITTSSSSQRTLASLDLSFNNIQGTIPPEVGLLSGLRRLDLDGGPSGFLTGTIPTSLGYLNLLESFSARGNQLSGTLPSEMGSWRLIRGIDLSYNKLTGSIPASFGSMSWLTELTLEINDFSGFLPPVELGQLRNLFKLALGGNQFSGPIPSEIGFLTKLRYLYLELNQFNFLPTEVGLLENLNVFSSFENNLEGVIPSELGRLTKLGTMILRSNALTSSIPSEIGLMEKLHNTLDFSFNKVTGPIPSEVGQLTLLRSLYLQSNNLSGAIPNEVAQLRFLNALRIESNDIVGVVPTNLCSVFETTFPSFYADCDEVACPCCTYCCNDSGGCTCPYFGTEQNYLC